VVVNLRRPLVHVGMAVIVVVFVRVGMIVFVVVDRFAVGVLVIVVMGVLVTVVVMVFVLAFHDGLLAGLVNSLFHCRMRIVSGRLHHNLHY
jgi:hypothetical protein